MHQHPLQGEQNLHKTNVRRTAKTCGNDGGEGTVLRAGTVFPMS